MPQEAAGGGWSAAADAYFEGSPECACGRDDRARQIPPAQYNLRAAPYRCCRPVRSPLCGGCPTKSDYVAVRPRIRVRCIPHDRPIVSTPNSVRLITSSARRRSGAGRARSAAPPRDRFMANKMLIDATHPEETRVVVVRGNRVEEFDFESANRKQLRGNIYLAKVTRVEPSLQAAFVDYGGNRHGFLAFSEIHPDYYQIPVADRQALIDEEERAHRDAEAEADRRAGMRRGRPRHRTAAHGSETSQAVSSEPVEAAATEDQPEFSGFE